MSGAESVRELDQEEWSAALGRFSRVRPDIYYWPQYYGTWARYERAEATCLFARLKGVDFLYPFFKKKIEGYDLEEDHWDIFTAYGYGGLLPSSPRFEPTAAAEVNRLIDEWCLKNRIVAEFVRQNRVWDLAGAYLRDVKQVHIRTNVYADLNRPLQEELSKSRRRYLNIARRRGLTSTIDPAGEGLDLFCELYALTMDKVKAEAYYYFDRHYFERVFDLLQGKVELVWVWDGQEPAAGAVCFQSGHNYTYHLGASDPAKLAAKPNDFLFYAILQRARFLGFNYVFWGGGMSTRPDDSLFQFKSRFGSLKFPCHIGRKIHLPLVYESLCQRWARRFPDLAREKGHILLKYRLTG